MLHWQKGEKVSSQLPDYWLDMTRAWVPDCPELPMLRLSRHGGPHPWVKFLKFLLILRTIRKVSHTSVILHPKFHYHVVNWGSMALTIISLATVTLGLRTHSFKSKPSLRSTLGEGSRAQQVTYTSLYNGFCPLLCLFFQDSLWDRMLS